MIKLDIFKIYFKYLFRKYNLPGKFPIFNFCLNVRQTFNCNSEARHGSNSVVWLGNFIIYKIKCYYNVYIKKEDRTEKPGHGMDLKLQSTTGVNVITIPFDLI